MNVAELEQTVAELSREVARLAGLVSLLQDPRGRTLLADTANPGSTHRALLEMIPSAAGNALAVLENGRSVSGTTDPGVFLAIPGLQSGQAAYYGFANGTTSAYVRISEQLRFGKVQFTDDCKTYCVVKESASDGTLLSDALVTVIPTKGGCDNVENGYCLSVGAVIAYLPDPNDPTVGVQVGAHKSVSLGYKCTSGTAFANVPGLSSMRLYNSDFFLAADGDCGDSPYTNRGNIYWRGLIVLGAYDGSICGATNTSSLGGVKVLDYTTGIGGAAYDTNKARIQFDVTCEDTTANQPTIGGTPCVDESGPKVAKIKGYFPKGRTIDASDTDALASCITAVFNENCSITITFNPPTMDVVVPFP